MPDENCRKCGFPLRQYLKCTYCKFVFQDICINCNEKTLPRIHGCINSLVA